MKKKFRTRKIVENTSAILGSESSLLTPESTMKKASSYLEQGEKKNAAHLKSAS